MIHYFIYTLIYSIHYILFYPYFNHHNHILFFYTHALIFFCPYFNFFFFLFSLFLFFFPLFFFLFRSLISLFDLDLLVCVVFKSQCLNFFFFHCSVYYICGCWQMILASAVSSGTNAQVPPSRPTSLLCIPSLDDVKFLLINSQTGEVPPFFIYIFLFLFLILFWTRG